jgi:hypothetical protein
MDHNIPTNELIKLYQQRKIPDLCKSNLTSKLDSDGNTIFHIVAMNLDQDTLEKFHQLIPTQTRDWINFVNHLGESPLHKALDSIEKSNKKDDQIITYMIKTLGANPEIPDKQNRIIVPIAGEDEGLTSPTTSLHGRIMKLNDNVIKNILDLSKMTSTDVKSLAHDTTMLSSDLSDQLENLFGKRSGSSSGPSQTLPNKKSSISTYMGNDSSDKVEFIKSLIKLYNASNPQEVPKEMYGGNFMEDGENEFDMHGGYKGKRKISAYMSDNDDFVVSDPDNMLNMMAMQDRPKVPQEIYDKNNEIYKGIVQTIKDNLNIDDETAKIVAAYLKIQVRGTIPKPTSDMQPGDIDRVKLDAVADIVKNKADLEKEYDKMTKDKLFEEIKENRKKREKEREERKSKFATKTSPKKDSVEDKSDKSDTSDKEAAEPPKKKRTTKKKAEESKAELSRISNATRKIASTGYLYSDEMVFSPDY